MSITGFLRRCWSQTVEGWWRLRAQCGPTLPDIPASTWPLSLEEPSAYYRRCHHAFFRHLPEPFREHRAYFHSVRKDRRGFGEDAFHAMWYSLLQEFQPASFLEIGVFRGQVISLVALWAKLAHKSCEVHGISPFSSAGDSVTQYPEHLDYLQDTLQNFDFFQLPHPRLLRARSEAPEARALISSRPWDMIYIDGNHDYEAVRQDWVACSEAVKIKGIIVLDDASLTTNLRPPAFASKGHPGPSRLAEGIDRAGFRELLQVGHNRVFQRVS